jgi:hypothetical protein
LVRFFDQDFYGGWHTYLDGVGGFSQWIRVPFGDQDNPFDLLTLYPLAKTYREWMPAFARKYHKGRHHRRPRGVAFMWAEFHGASISRLHLTMPSEPN